MCPSEIVLEAGVNKRETNTMLERVLNAACSESYDAGSHDTSKSQYFRN